MGKYRVKEPVAYVEGKKVVHHLKPTEWWPINDDVAATLGDAVERMDKPEKVEEPEPELTAAEKKRRTGGSDQST